MRRQPRGLLERAVPCFGEQDFSCFSEIAQNEPDPCTNGLTLRRACVARRYRSRTELASELLKVYE